MPAANPAFTVLDNALDFILEATGRLKSEPSEKDLKYAVLHLFCGIELILKERLSNEHFSLVFQDVSKAEWDVYQTGDFYSPNVKESLRRLKSDCQIDISEIDQAVVQLLGDKRNRLVHRGYIDSFAAIRSTFAKCLIFILNFIRAELEEEMIGQEAVMEEIQLRCFAFADFSREKLVAIGSELAQKSMVLVCPKCFEKALVLENEAVRCLFCEYQPSGEEAANEFVGNVLSVSYRDVGNGSEWPLYFCPECFQETLVALDFRGQGYGASFVCFGCTQEMGLEYCDNCGSPYNASDGMVMCSDCVSYRMGRD